MNEKGVNLISPGNHDGACVACVAATPRNAGKMTLASFSSSTSSSHQCTWGWSSAALVKHVATGDGRLLVCLTGDVFGAVDACRIPRVSITGVALLRQSLRFRRCWTLVRSSFVLAFSSSRLFYRSAWIVVSIQYRLTIVGRLASRGRASRGVEQSWDVMDRTDA